MFVAKNENRSYMMHELGAKQPFLKKMVVGLAFLFFVLVLIAGPMLLFSTFNPVSSTNPVETGTLQF